MKNNGFYGYGISGYGITGYGSAHYGLTGTMEMPFIFIWVWLLSSNIVPQPSQVVGAWKEDGIFIDTNIWYD